MLIHADGLSASCPKHDIPKGHFYRKEEASIKLGDVNNVTCEKFPPLTC